MTIFTKFILLLMGHALADYALQNDFVAKFKSSQSGSEMWPYVLISHGMIHGLMVYIITWNIYLALFEVVLHSWIDHLKCNGKITFHADQWFHISCKALWAVF